MNATGLHVCLVCVTLTAGAAILRLSSPGISAPSSAAGQGQPLRPAAIAWYSKSSLKFDLQEVFGKYYFGDGLGVNCSLEVLADHRFIFSTRTCLASDGNTGTWEMDGDIMILRPEKRKARNGFEGVSLRLVPVKWGRRMYLVDENKMPGFCSAARQGAYPAIDGIHGRDYVMCSNEPLPPSQGKPIIPERYRRFYINGPVKAFVINVNSNGTVLLDKGSADGLWPGIVMTLRDVSWKEVRVTEVRGLEATAAPVYFEESDNTVKVGDHYTTGDYWHRPWGTGYQRFSHLPNRKAGR